MHTTSALIHGLRAATCTVAVILKYRIARTPRFTHAVALLSTGGESPTRSQTSCCSFATLTTQRSRHCARHCQSCSTMTQILSIAPTMRLRTTLTSFAQVRAIVHQKVGIACIFLNTILSQDSVLVLLISACFLLQMVLHIACAVFRFFKHQRLRSDP